MGKGAMTTTKPKKQKTEEQIEILCVDCGGVVSLAYSGSCGHCGGIFHEFCGAYSEFNHESNGSTPCAKCYRIGLR